ncbi:transporter substrate-binding domain-containing protein [Labrenzia sp. 011]|uniref:substrate-binding periplasmic protein n=1 Tax=Labrenzia sp. 011 TaxID=2171494 RepID=UPI0014037E9C|nr:transporter substrate-binding domain-containing protein [Labrenzia sp. 011]
MQTGTGDQLKSGLWIFVCAVFAACLWDGPQVRADPRQIHVVTQDFAPLQWDNNGSPDGYVAEFMLAVVERVRRRLPVSVASFDFLPWKRAMLTAQSDPNVLIFSLSRTQAREEAFMWLGEVSPYGQYFYQLDTRPAVAADRIEDLVSLKLRIGVQDGGNLHGYLKRLGFDETGNLVPITDYHQGIEMLYLGRLDLLPLTGFLARASACRMGYDGALLQPVVFIEDLAQPLWAAFSQGSDPDMVEVFREEMAELRKDGFFDSLYAEHIDRWQKRACGG